MLKKIIFLICCFLLITNIIGIFKSFRSNEIKNGVFFNNEQKFDKNYKIGIKKVENTKIKTIEDIIYLNNLVGVHITHHFNEDLSRRDFFDNWIIYITSKIQSKEKFIEFNDYEKAFERGAGICSQQSIALHDILNKKKIDNDIIGLNGHVIIEFTYKNKKYIADPDYGVVINKSLKEIENNPKIIKIFYIKQNENVLNHLINVYGYDGNKTYDSSTQYFGWKKYYYENISYILIWIIPITGILFFLIYRSR